MNVYLKKNKVEKNVERTQLKLLMQRLNSGGTLIVYTLDRLGMNLSDMIHTHEKLLKNDVGVISISDNIDTRKKDDLTTKVMVTFLALFVEIERNYTVERPHSGRLKYVENGGKLGRTPKINKMTTILIIELLKQGKTKQEIVNFLKVDRVTIYRTLKRYGY